MTAESASSWIGKAVRRREDERLLRGGGRYLADLHLAGSLHATILRSPHAHARIASVDAAAARAHPGVAAVLTGRDLVGRLGMLSTDPWSGVPTTIVERARPRVRPDHQPILAIDRVRYVGEPVAVVVASDRYVAEDAAELIAVEYEPLPAVTSVEDATRPDATLLNEDWGDNVSVELAVDKGDAERAFREAPIVVRERLRSHRYTGVPIETRGVAAMSEPHDGNLVVWSTAQMPHVSRDVIAGLLGLPQQQVRLIAPDVGGGFGVKGHPYTEETLIAFLARELGRPVTWIEDRREHFIGTVHAREAVHEIEVAADREGRLLGLRDRIVFDKGAYNPLGMVLEYNCVAHLFGPYVVPAAHVVVQAVLTNKTPHAPYRGAGRPEANFAMERMLDRVATALDLDPAVVRRRNLIPADAMPYDTGLLYRDGQPEVYDSGDYPAMFRRALEVIEYERWRSEQARGAADGRRIGIGLAAYVEGTGVGPFESGSVTIDPSGRVRVATGACSQGQGHATTFAQVVADTLGVRLDQIDIVEGDTAAIPYGLGTVGSRSMVTAGSAISQAADRVRERALAVGAEMLEAAIDDLELVEGVVRVRGVPERAATLGRIAGALGPARPRTNGDGPGLTAEIYFQPSTVTYASGVHAAVVAVDVQTGQVEILRYAVVHDCGRVVNPTIVDGQVVGGVVQGIGGALLEDLVYDEQGQLLTTTLADYLLPTAAEVPTIELDHQEHLSPRNPLGVKGLGEGGAIGPPAAIANAVEDALRPLGVAVRECPLGPSQVREMLREARRP